jgi:hypothetical protein
MDGSYLVLHGLGISDNDGTERIEITGVDPLSHDNDSMAFGVGLIVMGVAATFVMVVLLVVL